MTAGRIDDFGSASGGRNLAVAIASQSTGVMPVPSGPQARELCIGYRVSVLCERGPAAPTARSIA